jgi:hypothetical protein
MKFYPQQVADFVPVWNLIADGVDVGLATNFPGEGWVYTVKHGDSKTTDYSCARLHEVLIKAQEDYARLIGAAEQEMPDEFIEDEDGEIARQRWEEDRADAFAEREYGHIPPEAW